MKKILFISAILLSAACSKTEAQLSVNTNVGRQPVWGPVGYDYVNYYYLPDLGVYYDVSKGMFVYHDFDRWNFATSLPPRYGRYDLYQSYKVVINDRNPWMRNNYYYTHYASYRNRYQPVIRDSHDNRYFVGREGYDNGRNHDYDGYRRGKKDKEKYDHRGNYHHDNGVRDHGKGNGRKGHRDRD